MSNNIVFPVNAALLEAAVLSISSCKDIYGYETIKIMGDVTELSESTLYPVLRRLQKSGCLNSYQQEYQGRNRRYYQITKKGQAQLILYIKEWEIYKNTIDNIFNEVF